MGWSLNLMSGSRTLIQHEARAKRPLCFSDHVVLTANLPWSEVLKIEHSRVLRGELPDSAPLDHLLLPYLNCPEQATGRIAGETSQRTPPDSMRGRAESARCHVAQNCRTSFKVRSNSRSMEARTFRMITPARDSG